MPRGKEKPQDPLHQISFTDYLNTQEVDKVLEEEMKKEANQLWEYF